MQFCAVITAPVAHYRYAGINGQRYRWWDSEVAFQQISI
jgi:hypothetical protein